jgi:uncharacterized membrane protein
MAGRSKGAPIVTLLAVKFIHIVAIAAWSAGLICMPFLYLQRRRLSGEALYRLHTFSRFLYVTIISPAAFVAIGSGTVLIFLQQTFAPWFSIKLAFVAVMVVIHVMNGLMILRLFEPGRVYPAWRFAAVTVLTLCVVSIVLVTVLGKPEFGRIDALADLFRPGALRSMAGDLIAWWR